ncbi:MAG: MalM family protein, partial [Rhodospirillales bacterium]|nr:MalM family protein [Rhodospirillales bacterium]
SSLVAFSMEENVEKVSLPTGPSLYKAIKLPDEKVTYYFKLRSLVLEDEQTKQKAAVLPVVAVLNDDFSLSRLSTLQNLSYDHWTVWHPYDHFNIYIKVDRQANPTERYVLIFTPAALLDKEMSYSRSPSTWNLTVPSGGALTTYPVQSRGIKFDLRALPTGSLTIEHITNPLNKPYDYVIRF